MKFKAFVITVEGNEHSEKTADRCIRSASKVDIHVEKYYGYNSTHDVADIANKEGILSIDRFKTNEFSRFPNVLAAFLSHRSLWKKCHIEEQPIIVFEHDAVVVDEIPVNSPFKHVMTIGKPSYGNFNVPNTLGVGPLISKPYFPGAHAYMMRPSGASMILRTAANKAEATDVFFNKFNFPWLQEYYPWPVMAVDTFSTIQYQRGCVNKHGYNDSYELIP